MRRRGAGLACVLLLLSATAGADPPSRRLVEVRRFEAAAARQGVAVDAAHFYAISNRAIEKYHKTTGRKVAAWSSPESGPIVHLNSGVVLDGRLYCAHSNYPGVPMWSSIEIFDTETLEPVDSHSFGIHEGSATWVDRHDGRWWVAFDDRWRRLGGWVFPPELVARFEGRSNSGGAWGPDGLLYATGHDAAELYVLRRPAAGAVLELVEILPVSAAGQGIAWDPARPDFLYTIVKGARQVVESRLVRTEGD